MHVSARSLTRVIAVLAAALIMDSCSRSIFTAPDSLSPETVTVPRLQTAFPGATQNAPPPAGQLTIASGSIPIVNGAKKLLNWVQVCDVLVRKDADTVFTASHYELHFAKGSLANDTRVTIKEYDPNVLDVQFGPDGTQFGVPVELSVDFRGTAADPGSALYDEREPVLYWLDESTNQWVEVPSRTDWVNRRLNAELQHFSRYMVGGKAGWGPTPSRGDN